VVIPFLKLTSLGGWALYTPQRTMRSRTKIEKDPKATELLILEVLLDIRELLVKQNKTRKSK